MEVRAESGVRVPLKLRFRVASFLGLSSKAGMVGGDMARAGELHARCRGGSVLSSRRCPGDGGRWGQRGWAALGTAHGKLSLAGRPWGP